MASLNRVFLMGNLTRNPELRYTPGGSAVCEFGLAINRRYLSNGQERDETCFVDIVVWSKQAETCNRILEKGAPVFIEGRLHFEQWQERDSGAKRSRLRVVADRVQFMPKGQGRGADAPVEPLEEDEYGASAPQRNASAPRPQQNGAYRQQYPQQNYNQEPQQQARGGYPSRQPQQQERGRQAGPPPMPDGAFDVENTEDDIPF